MRWRALTGSLVLLAVSACAGGTNDVPSATAEAVAPAARQAPGPCDLLTAEDVADVLGVTPHEVRADGATCTLDGESVAGLGEGLVSVRLEFGDVRPMALLGQYQATLRSALTEYESEDVPGLGDAAAWDGTALVATLALTPDRSAFIAIQLHDPALDLDARRDRSLALIERAIQRLRAASAGSAVSR